MKKLTKIEKKEALDRLIEQLARVTSAARMNGTLVLVVSNWRGSDTGLLCDIDVQICEIILGRPQFTAYLNNLIHDALGIRQNRKTKALVFGGYGYCRSDELARRLAKVIDLPIRCQQIGESFGPDGLWVTP